MLRGQPELAAVRLHDALRDGQAEPRAGAGAGAAGRLERRGGQLRRQPRPVVQHADDHLGRPGLGGHLHPGARRVVAERVVEQVHEDLLHPVVVGPHHRQAGVAVQRDLLGVLRRQAGDGRLDHQPDVAPVPLQPHDARLDRGEVQQVIDQPAEAGRLGRDPVQEALLGVAVPGHVRLHQAGRVAADGRQRGAQLMAEPGQEAALQLP